MSDCHNPQNTHTHTHTHIPAHTLRTYACALTITHLAEQVTTFERDDAMSPRGGPRLEAHRTYSHAPPTHIVDSWSAGRRADVCGNADANAGRLSAAALTCVRVLVVAVRLHRFCRSLPRSARQCHTGLASLYTAHPHSCLPTHRWPQLDTMRTEAMREEAAAGRRVGGGG